MSGHPARSAWPGARRLGRWAGPAMAAAVWLWWRPDAAGAAGPEPWALAAVAGVALWMAVWWMTETVPIAVTSLLPLVLLPALLPATFPIARVAPRYGSWQVFLFFGGFLVAIAMERCALHRRLALYTIRAIGMRPRRIVFGFMLATAMLSMWISNTATALMMLPIGMAVIEAMPDRRRFPTALMLGIAYAASIGGIGTPVGTPPNIAFRGIYTTLYRQAPPIGFGQWMAFALPLVAVLLPAAWWLLVRRVPAQAGTAAQVIEAEIRGLGRASPAERRVAVVFAATAIAWMTRQGLTFGALRLPGWGDTPLLAGVNDGVVALLAGLLLFLLGDGRGNALLVWEAVERRTPWGILLLFGGGFALADAVADSGLSSWIGGRFAFLHGLPTLLLVGAATAAVTFLTEITSNTATTQIMVPLAAALATETLAVHPLLLMLPVTVAASFAFMLPVATPPNAIVFGSGAVSMREMVRHGLLLNLLAIVVTTILVRLLAPPLFGIDLTAGPPSWAR